MSPGRRCWAGPVDDAALDQALAEGVLLEGDVAAIRKFRDYLATTAQQRATTHPATNPKTITKKAPMSAKPVQTQLDPRTYVISSVPADYADHHHFGVRVEDRGNDWWAVLNGGTCLSRSGRWDVEPIPSMREERWLGAHRFDLRTALRLATEAAPRIVVNGYDVAHVLAHGRRR